MNKKSLPTDPAALRITEEARKDFFSFGFSGVTMDDLATKMGMSKKTLYRYFPGKDLLLAAVIDHKLRSADRDLADALALAPPGVQAKLSAAVSCLMKHMREIQKPFIRDMQRLEPEFFARVEKRRKEMIYRHLGAVVEEGIRSGEMRSDVTPHLSLEILLGTVNAIMNPAKVEELGVAPQDALSAIFTIFMEGMLVRKGRGK